MSNTITPEQTNTEDHRLTVGELRDYGHLSKDVMLNLTNEEFEKMMGLVDSSTCIEPLYFPMSFSEQETQCIGYY